MVEKKELLLKVSVLFPDYRGSSMYEFQRVYCGNEKTVYFPLMAKIMIHFLAKDLTPVLFLYFPNIVLGFFQANAYSVMVKILQI